MSSDTATGTSGDGVERMGTGCRGSMPGYRGVGRGVGNRDMEDGNRPEVILVDGVRSIHSLTWPEDISGAQYQGMKKARYHEPLDIHHDEGECRTGGHREHNK